MLCQLTFKAINANGNPVAGASFSIKRCILAGAIDTSYETTATSDTNGLVTFNLPQGADIWLYSAEVFSLQAAFKITLPSLAFFSLRQFIVNSAPQSSVTQLQSASAFSYKGAIDCSSNPNWPAANAGDVYKVSVAGKIGGASGQVVQAGDVLTCNVSGIAGTDAAVGANWMIQQGNVVSTADVPASSNKNYATDAQLTVLGNLSAVTPFADGIYTTGLGVNSNGSITISKGLITNVVEAS